MSASGINYLLFNSLGSNERLAVYYDFTNPSTAAEGAGPHTGLLFNSFPSFDEGAYSALLLNITGSTVTGVENQLSNLFSTNNLDLTKTNAKIPITDINLNDFSLLLDFEFKGAINDGVIFGSFEKFQETVNSVNYTGANGFNLGVNSRGHLFFQCYSSSGDQIETLTDIELSKRNIIGLTSYGDSVIVSRFDYLNDEIESVEITTESNYLTNPDYFYFGGSSKYYSSSTPSDLTFSGSINELAIFSGAVSDTYLKYIGYGMLGDYYSTTGTQATGTIVTGYSTTTVYKTGITGYDYEVTGTLTLQTGREVITMQTGSASSSGVYEGDRYYKYYQLSNGSIITNYKEELGYLHPNSGYVYYPTGENAFATLGLQNISSSIITYIETEVTGQPTTTINLYGQVAKTGLLNEISGVIQTPLTENYITISGGSTGISFSGNSNDLKKNYIYYLGDRDDEL
jgi:hypothetical protein